MIVGEYGEFMPSAVGGSSTTYFADYFYTNVTNNTGQRGVLFGGRASYSANAGLSYSDTSHAPTNANAYVGSRLCFLPE